MSYTYNKICCKIFKCRLNISMAEELDEAVNDIIAPLKHNNNVAKKPVEDSILKKENL